MGNSSQRIEIDESCGKLIEWLTIPRTQHEIIDYINIKKLEISLDELIAKKMLTKNIVKKHDYDSRNEAFWMLYDDHLFQQKIKTLKVMLIGCGGIGNNISQQLARLSIGEIILVDNDEVELSNLNRQVLFGFEDVGKKKVIAAKESIQKFSTSKVSTELIEIENIDQLRYLKDKYNPDFVVLSADSSKKLQVYCHDVFAKNNIPFTTCGYANTTMISGPILDKENNEFLSWFPIENSIDEKYGIFPNSISPSIGFINSFISSFTVSEIMKYFMKDLTPKTYLARVQINFATWKIDTYKIN